MFKIYLIGFTLSLVAANPIVQRLPIPIQGQTCPAPTCTTCPTQTCPNTSRPTPCQACQNPYRNLFNSPTMLVRQPTNNCPCNNPVTVQGAVANQPINQEALTRLILRKLLSPPPQIPVPSPAIKSCSEGDLEANKPAPNIINNYIIIPPEFFKANATKVMIEDRTRTGKRRRKQNRQRTNDTVDVSCSCADKDELSDDDGNANNKEEMLPCPCDKGNITKSVPLEKIQDIKNTSQVNRDDDKVVPSSINTVSNNAEMVQSDNNIQNNVELSQKMGYTEPGFVDIEKPKRKYRIQTKNIEEAIIRDFCKRHPTIPEEIARSLLKKLKKHVESQGTLPYSPHYYLPSDYNAYDLPTGYAENEEDERVQNRRGKSNRGPRRRKPHRSGRRIKKPKEEPKQVSDDCDEKCAKIVAANPAVINIETETITTEKITASTQNKVDEILPIKDAEPQVDSPDNLINQLEQIKEKIAKFNEIETTTVNYNKHIELFPDLGKEDKVPTVYNNAVDDYYPDFRSENVHFYASDEECNIEKEKYHYTTDRNGGSDSKRYVTKKQPTLNNQNAESNHSFKDEIGSECSVSIPPDSDESYEDRIEDNSEEIHFRPPPHLELPDFQTKQINRFPLELNEQFVSDDFETVSSYSDARSEPRIPEIEMKSAKVFTKDKTGRTNIETVYGHSKVVRYGHDGQEAESDPVITYYLPEEAMTEDRIQLPDEETAVVVAKSIHDLVERWETI